MLSGCELIDAENISLPSQNIKFVGFFLLQTSKSPIFIKGFVSQCRSGVENTKVTTSLMT